MASTPLAMDLGGGFIARLKAQKKVYGQILKNENELVIDPNLVRNTIDLTRDDLYRSRR